MTLRSRLSDLLQRALGRSDIYAPGDGLPSVLYMRRWRLVDTRWGGIRVHNIVRSDGDREFHDHPFSFVSFILKGGYVETRDEPGLPRAYRRGSILYRKAETLHRLTLMEHDETEVDVPAWTFVVTGPRRREWGFMTEHGWIPWTEHVALREGQGEAAGAYAAKSSL